MNRRVGVRELAERQRHRGLNEVKIDGKLQVEELYNRHVRYLMSALHDQTRFDDHSHCSLEQHTPGLMGEILWHSRNIEETACGTDSSGGGRRKTRDRVLINLVPELGDPTQFSPS